MGKNKRNRMKNKLNQKIGTFNEYNQDFELNERKRRNKKGKNNPIYTDTKSELEDMKQKHLDNMRIKKDDNDDQRYEDFWKNYMDKLDKEEEELENSRKDIKFRSDDLEGKDFKDMNILERFIELTKYTYILGQEQELEYILPDGFIKDEIGNYYVKIGDSDTMFTCHLDTATSKKVKVNHIVENEDDPDKQIFVNTDGRTILGADDKSGVIILIHMIENKVPGLYYFFIGEEKGTVGSSGILKKNPTFFKNYKKCISFDRKAYGSVITKQFGTSCCSDEFSSALVQELQNACGTKFHQDPTGVYTDSAVFMDDISECTNISVGYFNEHTHNEHQNITYLEWLCNGAVKVNWEELPVKRDPEEEYRKKLAFRTNSVAFSRNNSYSRPKVKKEFQQLFDIIEEVIMQVFEMECVNAFQFQPEKEMIFETWDGENIMKVFIHNDLSISMGKDHFVDLLDLEQTMKDYYNYDISKIYDYYDDSFYDDDEDEEEDEEEDEDYTSLLDKKIRKNIKELDDDTIKNTDLDDEEPFEENINIDNFMKDIKIDLLNGKKMGSISAGDMGALLNNYDKTISSLIVWLYHKGNDPRKTGGLIWDYDYDEFYFEEQ